MTIRKKFAGNYEILHNGWLYRVWKYKKIWYCDVCNFNGLKFDEFKEVGFKAVIKRIENGVYGKEQAFNISRV